MNLHETTREVMNFLHSNIERVDVETRHALSPQAIRINANW